MWGPSACVVKAADHTFSMNKNEPYSLVLKSVVKPSSDVPFMMPKKTADT